MKKIQPGGYKFLLKEGLFKTNVYASWGILSPNGNLIHAPILQPERNRNTEGCFYINLHKANISLFATCVHMQAIFLSTTSSFFLPHSNISFC